MFRINGRNISDNDLTSLIIGKSKRYNCYSLTQNTATNHSIEIDNAIIATTTLDVSNYSEKVDFVKHYTNYQDFLKDDKIFGCYHVMILPLFTENKKEIEGIIEDLV